MMRIFLAILYFFFMVGCATVSPPNEEYILAKAALDAAKAVQAARYSPGFWHQAEEFYRQGKILYSEREYAEAKYLFLSAKSSAEKAENSARLLRQKSGDVL